MPVQTSYSRYYGEAFEGQKADMEAYNTVSKLNKGTAVIPFGRAVFTDGDDGMKLPVTGSTAAQFIGVTMRELTRAYTTAQATGGIGAVPAYDSTVLTMGVIWVRPAVAVVKDDPVYVVLADGTFSNVAGTTNVLVPNAQFVSTAAAGALAKISLVVGG
jgi:hypothetical protein